MVMQVEAFSDEVTSLGEAMRRRSGQADIDHLRRLDRAGRLCGVLGLATAWLAPNPASVALLAIGMMSRFVVGHAIGHGCYDALPGVPRHYTRRHFARGWRRWVDWLDWWHPDDWAFTHNQIHHAHTQSPLDGDVMDSEFLKRFPVWLRFVCLGLLAASWKYVYYAPRMRREHALKLGGTPRVRNHDMTIGDILDLRDPVVRTLWSRDYGPYIAIRFAAPTLLAWCYSPWAGFSMLTNLVLAELCHNAHTFFCIRPSHCAPDIPLFSAAFTDRQEFHLQSVLGTTNYRPGGDVHDLLHGWQNYQVEHHLWPTATLLQYRLAHPRLVSICAAAGVPYAEDSLRARAAKMARLFTGLEQQRMVDTATIRAR